MLGGRGGRIAALFLLLLLGSSSLLAESAAPPDPQQLARAVLDDDSFQTELPGPSQPPKRLPPWRGLMSLAKLLFWLLVLAGLAVLVWLLVDLRVRRTARATPAPPIRQGDTEAADPVPPSLEEIGALAREGRYGEAIHCALRRALAGLARRRGLDLRASSTSREILGQEGLSGREREALAVLVAQVERFLFARRTVGLEEYRLCADALRRLEGVA